MLMLDCWWDDDGDELVLLVGKEGGMVPKGPDIKLLDWISYPRSFRCEQYVNRVILHSADLGSQ